LGHGKTGKTGCPRDPSPFAQIAINKIGYSGAEAALFLGGYNLCVNRFTASEEIDEVKTDYAEKSLF
jgi:hypothetical protein